MDIRTIMLFTKDNTRKYIEAQIHHYTSFSAGITQLKKSLQHPSLGIMLDKIDQRRIQGQFKNWVRIIQKEGPIPWHIHALCFQLISMADPDDSNNSVTTIQAYGTAITPRQTELWHQLTEACFLPENRFLIPDDFRTIESQLKKMCVSPELAFFIFDVIIILLLLNSRNVIYKLFTATESDLFISAGRENADIYTLVLHHPDT